MAESFRKVYWVAPARAEPLGPALDGFLRAHEPELRELRAKWFGAPQPRDATDELCDLVARRLELMDAVGAWKRAHGKPVEDLAQEARVLDAVETQARALGLDPASVRALFQLEIELAKRIQRDAHPVPRALELDTELRPALARLSDRQLEALARAAPVADDSFDSTALAPLAALLDPAELAALRAALAGPSGAPTSRCRTRARGTTIGIAGGEEEAEMGLIAELLNKRTPVVHIVSPQQPVIDAVALMAARRVGAVPVVEGGRLVGIFSERDLLRRVVAVGRSAEKTPIGEVMTPDPVTAGPGDERAFAMLKMEQIGCRHLPIVQHGAVVDMLSIRDLLFGELEERSEAVESLRRYIGGSYWLQPLS